MRRARFITLVIAAICALLAVLNAKQWVVESFRHEADRLRQQALRDAAKPKLPEPVRMTTVVAASRDLVFGAELTAAMLREIPWPEDAVPAGAFRSIADVVGKDEKRYLLTGMRRDEVVLPSKVTGLGERPGLSALLHADTTAVTIRVNDVGGVAGFVLPGDRVDVLLTREASKREGDEAPAANDVLLQNVRVLAVDQLFDAADRKPVPAKTVTVEVPLKDAQRLALSAKVGDLSLALRQPGAGTTGERGRRVTLADLVVEKAPEEQARLETSVVNLAANLEPKADRTVSVTVVRAGKPESYQVPRR